MTRTKPNPDCETCGGIGETTIPAAQIAGRIFDEQTFPCHCTKQPRHEEE